MLFYKMSFKYNFCFILSRTLRTFKWKHLFGLFNGFLRVGWSSIFYFLHYHFTQPGTSLIITIFWCTICVQDSSGVLALFFLRRLFFVLFLEFSILSSSDEISNMFFFRRWIFCFYFLPQYLYNFAFCDLLVCFFHPFFHTILSTLMLI